MLFIYNPGTKFVTKKYSTGKKFETLFDILLSLFFYLHHKFLQPSVFYRFLCQHHILQSVSHSSVVLSNNVNHEL